MEYKESGKCFEFDYSENPKKSSQLKLFLISMPKFGIIQVVLFNPRTRKALKREVITNKDFEELLGVSLTEQLGEAKVVDFCNPCYCWKTKSLYFKLKFTFLRTNDVVKSKIINISEIFSQKKSLKIYHKSGENPRILPPEILTLGNFEQFRLYYVSDDCPGEIQLLSKCVFEEDSAKKKKVEELEGEGIGALGGMDHHDGQKASPERILQLGFKSLKQKIYVELIDTEHILFQGDLTLTLYNFETEERLSVVSFQQKFSKKNSFMTDDLIISWEKDWEHHALYKATQDLKLHKLGEFYLSEVLNRDLSSRGDIYLQKDIQNPNHYILFTEVLSVNNQMNAEEMNKEFYFCLLLDQNLKVKGSQVREKSEDRIPKGKNYFLPVKGANLMISYAVIGHRENMALFQLIDLNWCGVVDSVTFEIKQTLNLIARDLQDPNSFIIVDYMAVEIPDQNPAVFRFTEFFDWMSSQKRILRVLSVNLLTKKFREKTKYFRLNTTGFAKKNIDRNSPADFGCYFVAVNQEKEVVEFHFYNADQNGFGRVVSVQDGTIFGLSWDYGIKSRMISEDLILVAGRILVDLKDRVVIGVGEDRPELF